MRAEVWAVVIVLIILVLAATGVFGWFFIIKPRYETRKCTKIGECPEGTFCSVDAKQCLDYGKCYLSSDCIGGQVCVDGVCTECQTSKDCVGVPGKSVCSDGRCVGCVKTTDCSSGVCDTSIQRCVECLKGSQCPGGHCLKGSSPTLNRCVQCVKDSQCNTGEKCIGNACRSSKAVLKVDLGPPPMPPITNLGLPLKSLEEPLEDPFSYYHEYKGSW